MTVSVEKPKTIESVLSQVAHIYGYEVEELVGHGRKAELAEARHVAMFILWTMGYSLAKIGDVMGGRTPATVSNGYQVIVERTKTDDRLKRRIEVIMGMDDYMASEIHFVIYVEENQVGEEVILEAEKAVSDSISGAGYTIIKDLKGV